MVERFPRTAECAHWANDSVEQDFKTLDEIAHSSRSVRTALGLTSRRLDLYAICGSPDLHKRITEHAEDLATLAFATKVMVFLVTDGKQPAAAAGCICKVLRPDLELRIPVAGVLDLSSELSKAELQQEKLLAEVRKLESTIAAPGYEKTRTDVRAGHHDKLVTGKASLVQLGDSVALFASLMTHEQVTLFKASKAEFLTKKLAVLEADLVKATAPAGTGNAQLSKKAVKQLGLLAKDVEAAKHALATIHKEEYSESKRTAMPAGALKQPGADEVITPAAGAGRAAGKGTTGFRVAATQTTTTTTSEREP